MELKGMSDQLHRHYEHSGDVRIGASFLRRVRLCVETLENARAESSLKMQTLVQMLAQDRLDDSDGLFVGGEHDRLVIELPVQASRAGTENDHLAPVGHIHAHTRRLSQKGGSDLSLFPRAPHQHRMNGWMVDGWLIQDERSDPSRRLSHFRIGV